MKLFLRYLKSRLGVLLLFAAFALILACSFLLYRLPVQAVLYPAALCLVIGAAALVLDFLRIRRRHRLLGDLSEMESELPETADIEAADFREIILRLREMNRELTTRAETDRSAMVDYYTLWVHQIKTPIASMRLRLQEEDTAQARSLLADLGRVERYVSMVLTYLRLEEGASDYVIRETDLDSVLRPVLRQFAGEFISRRLKLDYTPAQAKVLTLRLYGIPLRPLRPRYRHWNRPGGPAPDLRPELYRSGRAHGQARQRYRPEPVQARLRQPGPRHFRGIRTGQRHRRPHRPRHPEAGDRVNVTELYVLAPGM